MDKNDAVTVALQVVLGSKRQAPDKAGKEQKDTGRQQPRHKPGCNPEEPFGRTQFVKELPHQLVTIFTVIVWLVAGPKEPISCSKD